MRKQIPVIFLAKAKICAAVMQLAGYGEKHGV